MIIYCIRNLINDKVYIGQTNEKHEGQRKRQHFHRLNKGTHNNPYLQSAYNKYGAKAFQFEIVDVVSSLYMLNLLEKTWIAFYRANGRSYNLRDGGDVSLVSDETKRRMTEAQNDPKLLELRSKVHKGVPKSEEHKEKLRQSNIKAKTKSVIKYSINGEIIQEFETIPEAFNDWGRSKSGFESHLYNEAKSKNFYYRLK